MSNSESRPTALVVTGVPGAGKSTLARGLCRALPAALLDLDTATAELTGVVSRLLGGSDRFDLDDERLAGLTRAARYATLTAPARENLDVGMDVVLVAPYTSERRDARAWSRLAGELRSAGGEPVLVWLGIESDLWHERIRTRGAARDAARLASPDRMARIDPAPPMAPHLALDAGLPQARLVEQVMAAVGR